MEKHITITIIRSNLHLIHPQTYYITKSGVLQSLRKPQDGTIRIGRETIRDTNFVFNDIMLNTQNPLISRSHCLINYQEFFREAFSDTILSFLMGGHSRLGQHSILLTLPQTLFKYILDFVTEPRLPIIVSPVSITYLRVSSLIPQKMQLGMGMLLGSEGYFTVEVLDEFVCVIKSDSSGNCFHFPYEEEREFRVGKAELDEDDVGGEWIDKVQFRVKCWRGKWWLVDGESEKASLSGTWVRVGNLPEYLANKSEIKIGEYILRAEW